MSRDRPSWAGRGWLPVVMILIVTVAVEWVFLAKSNEFIDSKIEERASDTRDEAKTAALALRQNLSHTLDQINALHGLARLVTVSRQAGDMAMEKAAKAEIGVSRGTTDKDVLQVGGIALTGYLDWTSIGPEMAQVYLGDREDFQAIANGKAEEVIGRPTVGSVTGRRSIDFTRSVRGPSGELSGMTFVCIDSEMLSGLATAMELHGTDTLTILRRDGVVLARSGDDRHLGNLASPDTAQMHAFLGSPSGMTQGVSPVDGVDRVVAWQRLDENGLILVVGLDRESGIRRLQPTITRVHRLMALTTALIVILGVGSAVTLRWRRRAAAAEARATVIRESEGLFRQLAEGLPDMIRLLDRDGTVIYASAAARDILGVEPEYLLGRPSDILVHPEDLSKVVAPVIVHQPIGTRRLSEIRMVRPDGKTIWVQTNLRTVTGDRLNAKSVMIVSATRDVTGQREAETALRQAKEELDAMLTATRAMLFRARIDTDETFHTLFVSDSAEHLIGYTPTEMIETPNWFVTHDDPAFAKAHRAHLYRIRTEGSSRINCRLRHKHGHWLWVSMFTRRVEGEGLTVVGTITDVTREHEQEAQLAQSAKMALLGEMTTGMAHELNQPLAAIGMMAENGLSLLEEDGAAAAPVRGKLERIREQVKRAATIIDHMRVFGRKPDDAPTRVLVASAIEGAHAILGTRLEMAAIEVVTHVEPDVPPIIGHLVLLEQVLMNLIANAADAIEAHSPPLPPERRCIEVRASLTSGMVDITIVDHAGGINEAALPRLFEPFFTTKPVGHGTGLGLSIGYGIVAEMGGTITARNEHDGAAFHIRLSPA